VEHIDEREPIRLIRNNIAEYESPNAKHRKGRAVANGNGPPRGCSVVGERRGRTIEHVPGGTTVKDEDVALIEA
jgi:hypothetical protein